MSFGVKEASKSRRCPVCGKPDYCGFQMTQDGELIICKRATESKGEGVIGTDGEYYLCVGISRTGNSVFMEARNLKEKGSESATRVLNEPPVYIDPVEVLPNSALDKIYRIMASKLHLEDRHRKYLYSEGWTDEMIEKYHVVSFPEKDFSRFKFRKDEKSKNPYRKRLAKQILEELGNPSCGLKGVPGASMNESGEWTFCGPSGIIFWQYDVSRKIYRARIRMDYRDVSAAIQQDNVGEFFVEDGQKWYICMSGAYKLLPDGTRSFRKDGQFKGKYRNLSSFYADEKEEANNRIVNIYKQGVASGNNLSFLSDPIRDDMHIAYVTEGEKKGAFANYKLRAPFISLPGVDSWTLLLKGAPGSRPVDILKKEGCRVIVVAFDADKATNATVLDRECKTVEALKKEGFILGVASWDIEKGKGIDDLLAAGYKPNYESY